MTGGTRLTTAVGGVLYIVSPTATAMVLTQVTFPDVVGVFFFQPDWESPCRQLRY